MARINLRPWREELREEKQKEYVSVLVLVTIVAGAIWWFANGALNSAIEVQQGRNSYLQKQASALDKKIVEIRELRQKREELLDRMRLIQELQGNRPVIVRVFDEMARVIPDEVFFVSVKVKGKRFTVDGRASSNDEISQLMRNFDESAWFSDPNLLKVQAGTNGFNDFDLLVDQSRPEKDEVK
ncbi:pilus assembly protein PilN [Bermanella marisrubri]|uniref:Type 4 fimbrial biogenesis protein PilN n=1 Tax=Bermanella marisrubri TaxID=207949 RepID=Q1N2I1_9GAMM|nr:PilN domain-containing protein [Bermanella marisrubri]EAT12426.1 type 4 fimbrial biogenesis protein PilN [Oceanobacter sp. RED65] [Bermanella marisrubri]QIZ85507.1 pilus assembly protein PilN [Bermanella marisrubri]